MLRTPLLCLLAFAFGATAHAADRPNILFAIADDWSHGHAGAYGNGWVKTPGFDYVAKHGILFTNAYTNNAKCCPARSILLTGRHSWQLKAAANHICYFPPEFKTYTEVLTENGYFVGFTGKGWGPGVAKDKNGKARQMTGRRFSKRRKRTGIRGISPNDYAGNFGDFLKAAPKGKPWCFWYGATEPHRGYQPGIGMKRGKKLGDIKHVPKFWPDNKTIRSDMLDYAVEVEHFDSHVKRMVDQLEADGQLDNTLIVVTSDHGMPFPRCKGQAYEYSNHIPMAVMWKAGIKNSGRTVTDFVSFIDIAPTFLQAAGVDWKKSGMSPTPGRSMFDVFNSKKAGRVNVQRDHVLIGKERHDIGRPHDHGYPIRGIVTDRYLFLRNYKPDRWPGGNPETGYLNCDGSPTKTDMLKARYENNRRKYWQLNFGKRPAVELYDIKTDPDCVNNLASSTMHRKTAKQLETRMVGELRKQGDPRMFGKGDVFEKYQYANRGTRNFYERYMKGEKLRAGWVNASDFQKK